MAFWDTYEYENMDQITQILENVVRCKYIEAGVHIKNPIKNWYEDGLGRMTQTLDHVVVVHILIWDKRKSQINEYSDKSWPSIIYYSNSTGSFVNICQFFLFIVGIEMKDMMKLLWREVLNWHEDINIFAIYFAMTSPNKLNNVTRV